MTSSARESLSTMAKVLFLFEMEKGLMTLTLDGLSPGDLFTFVKVSRISLWSVNRGSSGTLSPADDRSSCLKGVPRLRFLPRLLLVLRSDDTSSPAQYTARTAAMRMSVLISSSCLHLSRRPFSHCCCCWRLTGPDTAGVLSGDAHRHLAFLECDKRNLLSVHPFIRSLITFQLERDSLIEFEYSETLRTLRAVRANHAVLVFRTCRLRNTCSPEAL